MINNNLIRIFFFAFIFGCSKKGSGNNDGGVNHNLYPLAFQNSTGNTTTIVLINDNASQKAIKVSGTNLPAQFNLYVTSANDDSKDYGLVNSTDVILLPASSVVTLSK